MRKAFRRHGDRGAAGMRLANVVPFMTRKRLSRHPMHPRNKVGSPFEAHVTWRCVAVSYVAFQRRQAGVAPRHGVLLKAVPAPQQLRAHYRPKTHKKTVRPSGRAELSYWPRVFLFTATLYLRRRDAIPADAVPAVPAKMLPWALPWGLPPH